MSPSGKPNGQLRGRSPLFVPGPPAEIGNPGLGVLAFLLKHAEGRVLDIGGGKGAYAMELRKRGFAVTLAEKDPEALAAAAASGLDVIDMNRTDWAELKGRFDTVLLVEVLEHIDEYRGFLAESFGCAGTKLLLTVPCNDDFDDLFAANLTYNHIAVSDHVNHFTSADLRELFAGLPCDFTLERGDFLFPGAFLHLMRAKLRGSLFGSAVLLPLRVLNRLGWFPATIPGRCFVAATRKK
jgi:SAM-dependent methyltransferase